MQTITILLTDEQDEHLQRAAGKESLVPKYIRSLIDDDMRRHSFKVVNGNGERKTIPGDRT